jgi:hypothetical protein
MATWFRFYAEALDDPKVQKLDPATFKMWVNLLCLACRNEGFLPHEDDVAFALRIDIIAWRSLADRLLIGGLIDVVKGGPNGSRIAPHGWQKRQYKSDTSSERVKRFRERSKTVTETPPETETETEVSLAKANDADGDSDTVFWDHAKAYLGKSRASVIGKWVRDHGQAETARAITAAQIARAVDPVPYIERALRGGSQAYPEGHSGVPL